MYLYAAQRRVLPPRGRQTQQHRPRAWQGRWCFAFQAFKCLFVPRRCTLPGEARGDSEGCETLELGTIRVLPEMRGCASSAPLPRHGTQHRYQLRTPIAINPPPHPSPPTRHTNPHTQTHTEARARLPSPPVERLVLLYLARAGSRGRQAGPRKRERGCLRAELLVRPVPQYG